MCTRQIMPSLLSSLTMVLLTFSAAPAAATPAVTAKSPPMEQKGPTPQKRAFFGIETFVKGCFASGGSEEKLLAFMGDKFLASNPKGTLTRNALEATGAKEGKLWGGNFPQGQVAILFDSEKNCHTLVYGGDPASLHQGLKDFKDFRKEDPTSTYSYKPKEVQDPGSRDQSFIRINTPESGPVEIKLTTTPGSSTDLTGIITVKPAGTAEKPAE